jgi:uncharacterized RDD family membrane protein YckC
MNDTLDNLVGLEIKFKETSKNKRFLNNLIDSIVHYLLVIALSAIFGAGLGFSGNMEVLENENTITIFSYLLSYFTIFLYYSVFEYYSKGKTLGKYITKSRALREDGSIMNFSECALRSVCRLIPFDRLSFLGSNRGWHDRFSKTMVVEDDDFLLSQIEGM